jgi:anaphase-promoting complex subunit 4
MLPALERCNVILSRLLGIAKYQGSNNTLGFSSQQISLIMETVACLNLVSAKILTLVVDEIDSFAAFSSWMRHEIDKLASTSLSASADDQIEKESAIDHSKVLLYIQGSLMESRLSVFFDEDAPENSKNEGNSMDGLPMFHQLSQQLKNHNKNTGSSTSFLRLNFLFETLERQANGVFQGIAEAERRNVMFGEPVALEFSPGCSRMYMIVCPEVRDLHRIP